MTPLPYDSIFYPECIFGGFTDIDGTITFYTRVNALARPEFCVINFGCGRGAHDEDLVEYRKNLVSLKGKVARVVGMDIDPVANQNPAIDEFVLLPPSGVWPVPDGSAHMIVCDQVMEHLPSPPLFFAEAKRVLAPGGCLCVRTTNVLSYAGMAARLVPNRLHAGILRRLKVNREEEDVFPTLFRCNTVSALRRQLTAQNFHCVVYGYEAEPSYLRISKLTYGIGVLHQRLAPRCVRPTIFAFGRAPEQRA